MFDLFLFVGLPYVALVSLIVGSIVRYRTRAFSYSSLSTQFLEDRWLVWASLPWHVGIIVVLLGHVLAFCLPGTWAALMSVPMLLFLAETIGLLSATLCLISLIILLARRFVNARLQAVTSYLDVVVLLLLFFQVVTGLGVATHYRWGAAWAPGALGPYLAGIFVLKPNPGLVTDLPPLVKMHIASAWVILMLFPFTRLVHVFSLPVWYFLRSPQKVVWNNTRAQRRLEQTARVDDERRLFFKAMFGLGGGAFLLSLGTLDKLLKYFLKQDLTTRQEARLLSEKLQRLNQSAEQRKLELERIEKDSILVAPLAALSRTKGKYFIDYQMRPALAFKDEQGLPIVLSAKCTHLGCTVGQDVDAKGRILCPCHISYFDIKTGRPEPGSPAKDPLPRLGWVLKNSSGQELLSEAPDGRRQGTTDPAKLKGSFLYIVKRFV